jgi:hypothetical protein
MFEPSRPLTAIVIAVSKDIYHGADEPDLATGFWIDGARRFGERLQAFGDARSGQGFIESAEKVQAYWMEHNDELDDWISDTFGIPDPRCPDEVSTVAWEPIHRLCCATQLSFPPDMPEEFQDLRITVLAYTNMIRRALAKTSRIVWPDWPSGGEVPNER